MADGTAPEKTSFANAWIRRAVTEPDKLFGSGDIKDSPYGGGGDGFLYNGVQVLMVKAIRLVVAIGEKHIPSIQGG
jgi:hypothetical protein